VTVYNFAAKDTRATSGRKVAEKTGATVYKPAAGFAEETRADVPLTLAATHNIPVERIGPDWL